jgi:hypothetical protein
VPIEGYIRLFGRRFESAFPAALNPVKNDYIALINMILMLVKNSPSGAKVSTLTNANFTGSGEYQFDGISASDNRR